jgi:hypothetical protein
LNKLNALEAAEPVRRYVRENPGELIHIDIKKLRRIGSEASPADKLAWSIATPESLSAGRKRQQEKVAERRVRSGQRRPNAAAGCWETPDRHLPHAPGHYGAHDRRDSYHNYPLFKRRSPTLTGCSEAISLRISLTKMTRMKPREAAYGARRDLPAPQSRPDLPPAS